MTIRLSARPIYYLAMPDSAEGEQGIGLMLYDWQKSDDQPDPVASWLSDNENKSTYAEVMFEESDSVGKGSADQYEGPVPESTIMVRDLFESDEFPLVSSLVACRADTHYRAMEFVFPAMQLDDADMAGWTEDSVNSVVRWACDKAALQAALAAAAESAKAAKAAEARASEQARIASANAELARTSASSSAGKSAGTMDWLSRGCWHQKRVVGEAVKTKYMCFSNDGAVNFSYDRLWRILEHHVDPARTHEYYDEVKRVGIDETASRRGQKYITVVHDLDAGRIVFACEGRDNANAQSSAQTEALFMRWYSWARRSRLEPFKTLALTSGRPVSDVQATLIAALAPARLLKG